MVKYDIFEYPTLVLAKLGIYSETNSTKIKILSSLYMLMAGYTMVTAIILMFWVNGDVAAFTSCLEGVGGMAQVLIKFGAIGFLNKDFVKLINHTKYFWETDKCSDNVKIPLDNILYGNILLQKMFFFGVLGSAFLVEVSVILGKSLPLGMWKKEENDLFYYSILGLQVVFVPVAAFFISAFDCLFLGLCAKAVIQFRILYHCLENLHKPRSFKCGEEEYVDQLKFYIRHHIYSLRYIENLRNLFSTPLLVQYVTSSSAICANMYAVTENKDMKLQARLIMSTITQIVQVAFYCIPADYVTYAAFEVAQAFYNSEWYLGCSPSARTLITIAIQKSQQEITMRAGGFIDVNSKALITILRVCWSICTVMKRI